MVEPLKVDVVVSEINSLRRYLTIFAVLILLSLALNGSRVYTVDVTIRKLRKENICLRHMVDTNQRGNCDAPNQ